MTERAEVPTPTITPTSATTTGAPLLVDAVESGRLCGVSRSMWLSLADQGRTPRSIRLGRRRLWSRQTLISWVAAGCPPRDRWEASHILEAGTQQGRRR